MKNIINRLLVILTLAAYLSACGGYTKVTMMVPQPQDTWKTSDYSCEFTCNGNLLLIHSPIVYSRPYAMGPLWIPIPFLQEQKPSVVLTDPMRLRLFRHSESPGESLAKTCDDKIIRITSPTQNSKVIQYVLVEENHGVMKDGRNLSCEYETPPITEAGEILQIQFGNSLLDCDIPNLVFKRKDSLSYGGGGVSF